MKFQLKLLTLLNCRLAFIHGLKPYSVFQYRKATSTADKASADEFLWKSPEFGNSQVIYKVKKTSELLRAYLVFTACSFDFLVDNQTKILKWTRKLVGRSVFSWLMEKTVAGQFLIGEATEALQRQARIHAGSGIGPMFAYTAGEFHGGSTTAQQSDKSSSSLSGKEVWFEKNLKEVMRSVDVAASCKEFSTIQPIVCTKITFMAQFDLLESLSSVILQQNQFVNQAVAEGQYGSQAKKELLDFLATVTKSNNISKIAQEFQPISQAMTPNKDFQHLPSLLTNVTFHLELSKQLHLFPTVKDKGKYVKLSDKEISELAKIWKRMTQLNQLAVRSNVLLNYDAEQTYIQPAIEALVLDSMRQSNRSTPSVLNTYQCYLKRTLAVIEQDIKIAMREGFCFGGKIVRGAYIDEETKRSKTQGYVNPVNDSYDATTAMYLSVMNAVLNHTQQQPGGKSRIIFATHNQDTVTTILNELKQRQLNPTRFGISFAQLLGTRDFISFALGAAGYPAAKLIHYASPEDGIAYLSRRLQENRSGLPSPAIERRLLAAELKARTLPFSRK